MRGLSLAALVAVALGIAGCGQTNSGADMNADGAAATGNAQGAPTDTEGAGNADDTVQQ